MTALDTLDTRTGLVDDLAEATRLLRDVHRRLDFAQYPETTQLMLNRARLARTVVWASEVMGSLALLGTDQEGHE